MSRKHFKMFAEAIARINEKEKQKEIMDFLIPILEQSNPDFDRGRFEDYIRKRTT